MARASKTGVRGLYRDDDGRFRLDLRWRDAKTGEPRRHQERLPPATTSAAAKVRAREILSAALIGDFDPKRPQPKKLRAAFDGYLEWLATERPRSVRDRRFHSNALVSSLGDIILDAITPLHVERFKKAKRAEGCAPGTVNRHLTTLKHFARKVREWHWMRDDVAGAIRGVRLLREPPGRVRYLTPDEEGKLFEAMPAELRVLALAADLSGMRRSEIAMLRWSNVDLAHRVITLTKTKSNRVRRIPLHDALAVLLEALPGPRTPEAWVFTLPTAPSNHTRVKRSEEDRRREYVTKTFREAADAAKIADIRFHDLRHDFATRLRRAGAGIDAIAKLLGHSTLAMATRYAHLDDPTLREAVRAVAPPRERSGTADSNNSGNVIDLATKRISEA